MKKNILFIALVFSFGANCEDKLSHLYKKVFPNFDEIQIVKIKDPISDEPTNLSLKKVFKKKKLIGHIRDIKTTTGCNSSCLPIIYSSFYTQDAKFIKVLSLEGLTKINHTPFSEDDYAELNFLISLGPNILNSVKHPKDMTDALSGETLKKYKKSVVKGAAYSTLRIHLYNQQTMKFLKDSIQKKSIH